MQTLRITHPHYESVNSSNINNEFPNESKIAICVTGGLRTFYRPLVHQSLLHNFINGLEPTEDKRDIFFVVSNEIHCAYGRGNFCNSTSLLPDSDRKFPKVVLFKVKQLNRNGKLDPRSF